MPAKAPAKKKPAKKKAAPKKPETSRQLYQRVYQMRVNHYFHSIWPSGEKAPPTAEGPP